MEPFEVDAVLEAHINNVQRQWEQTRFVCYYITASQSTKPVDMQKMMPFSWDVPKTDEPKKTMTAADRKRLTELAETIVNKQFNSPLEKGAGD